MANSIRKEDIIQLKKDYEEILQALDVNNYFIPEIPTNLEFRRDSGEVYSMAYPIQGILKYHGFSGDPNNRIAYFPSISLNNSCANTISFLKFDKNLKEDHAILNGNEIFDDKLERIKLALNVIRDYSQVKTKAVLVSRNFLKSIKGNEIGKGLGTSASGSAALALAATSIVYDNCDEYLKNRRLISFFSRYLSGSGCRSAVGGLALWLSHPTIDPLDCFAVRLDKKEHQSFIDNISLLTIPIESELKTDQAHKAAPTSPYFLPWLKQRKQNIIAFIDALNNHKLDSIGEIAEYDTNCLHHITITAREDNIIAWKPDTLKIMIKTRELREKNNYHVYYSIDTGPSVVLITLRDEKKEIIEELNSIIPQYDIIEGSIAGPSKLLNPKSSEAKKLEEDLYIFKYNHSSRLHY